MFSQAVVSSHNLSSCFSLSFTPSSFFLSFYPAFPPLPSSLSFAISPFPCPPNPHVHTYTHLFSFSLHSVAWPCCHSDRELLLSHRPWKLERNHVGKRQGELGRGGEVPGGVTRTPQPLHIRTTPWPGATDTPCRSHRGFASKHSRRHLNTWYAHGQLLSRFALPQACWSVLS